MVQDTSPSSEMYLWRYKSGNMGGWGVYDDNGHSSQDVDYADLRECNVFWAVSIPGESLWCTTELDGEHGRECFTLQ